MQSTTSPLLSVVRLALFLAFSLGISLLGPYWVTASLGANARPGEPGHAASVRTCIHRWNRAHLGSGRKIASGTVIFGRAALVSLSEDGACIVAFPRVVADSSNEGVFLNYDDGDYSLEENPMGTSEARRPLSAAKLEAAASNFTNVEFASHGGVIDRLTSHRLSRQPATVVSKSPICKRFVVVPTGEIFNVVKRSTSCLMTRVIAWAWSERRGRIVPASTPGETARNITGWRCEGETAHTEPIEPLSLKCRKSSESFVLATGVPHALGNGI